ncbi:hypothetical protein QE152_g3783 [Popillia japonica]|uniref:Uncharacterized protein n=1 Tax=Popillia japonica TaxID=7064 RepID=A0AAW1N2U4_POPJA
MAGVQNAVADDVDGDGEEEEEEEVNGRQFRKPITAEVGRVGGAARLVAAEVERTLRTRSRRDVFGVDAGAARLSRETRTTPPSPSLHRRSRTTDRFRRVFWGGFSVRRRVEEDGSANERLEKTTTAAEDEFKLVGSRRKRKTNIIRGSAENNLTIRAVKRLCHMHVYGLAVETSETDLKSYLVSCNVRDVSCERLQARRPNDYSSFKVSCELDDMDIMKDPNIWPKGTKINRFFFHNQQREKMK